MASLTRPAAWTEAEQKQLETLARRYPSSEHSLVTQCAKIAAGLPRKSIRDVGARLRLLALDPLATAQPARPGTARPMTSLGRLIRIGTASMLSESGGPFIRVDRLDLKKYAQRPELAKVLFDYILYHGHNPRKALELANHATQLAQFEATFDVFLKGLENSIRGEKARMAKATSMEF